MDDSQLKAQVDAARAALGMQERQEAQAEANLRIMKSQATIEKLLAAAQVNS